MNRLCIGAAIAALEAIETVAAAFVETAPETAAKMGGADGIIHRCEITPIGPMPRLALEEWLAMAAEHATAQKTAITSRMRLEAGDDAGPQAEHR